MNKICVSTFYTEDIKDLYDLISLSYKKYCDKNNYDFVSRNISYEIYDRHPVWYKIYYIQELLNKYEWVLFVDCDTLLTNDNIKIENFIKDEKDLYISKDINGINAGVMLIKNSEWSKIFLDHCWNIDKNDPIYHEPGFSWNITQAEQRAIIVMIKKFGLDKVEFLPQNIFNAYIYNTWNLQYPQGEWNKNSFILHAPGCSLKQRLEMFKNKLNE